MCLIRPLCTRLFFPLATSGPFAVHLKRYLELLLYPLHALLLHELMRNPISELQWRISPLSLLDRWSREKQVAFIIAFAAFIFYFPSGSQSLWMCMWMRMRMWVYEYESIAQVHMLQFRPSLNVPVKTDFRTFLTFLLSFLWFSSWKECRAFILTNGSRGLRKRKRKSE